MHPSMFTVNKNVSEMTHPLSFCMGSMALMALGGVRWLNINVSVTVGRQEASYNPATTGFFVRSRRGFISLLFMALGGKFGVVWSPVKKNRGSFHGRNCIMSKALFFCIRVFFFGVYFIFNGKKIYIYSYTPVFSYWWPVVPQSWNLSLLICCGLWKHAIFVKQNWYNFLATFYGISGVFFFMYFRFAWYVTGMVFMALGGALRLVLIIRNKETIFVPGLPQSDMYLEFMASMGLGCALAVVLVVRQLAALGLAGVAGLAPWTSVPRGRSGTSFHPLYSI